MSIVSKTELSQIAVKVLLARAVVHAPVLWSAAIADHRALITTDRGFTEYRAFPHYGIAIVRLRQPNRHRIHKAVMIAIERFREEEWPGLLVVVRDATLSVSRGGGPVERS